MIKIPELRDGVSFKTPRNDGLSVPQKNWIDTGDLLFSWSGTLLVNEWLGGPALLNQHLFKVTPRIKLFKRYLRLSLEAAIPNLLGQSVGATMQHIRKSALDDNYVLLPTEDIRKDFSELVDPIFDQIGSLRKQNDLLISVRDEFLSKLMNREIQV